MTTEVIVDKTNQTTTKLVESKKEKDRTTAKAMVVAFSCDITKIKDEKETYKVQSETNVDRYYIVRFMDGTPIYCSCLDFSHRSRKNSMHVCKHMKAVIICENNGLVREPESQKCTVDVLPYTKEEYSF